MSKPKLIQIKESIPELRKLQRDNIPMISARIRVLIEFKKNESTGISKRQVADICGVDPNSVQKYRTMYEKEGIKALLNHDRKGARPSLVSASDKQIIEQKLNDPRNGLRGYIELLDWVKNELGLDLKYNTLLKYSIRNFGSKVKVARKSHVKKDEEAGEAFKKTSVRPANKQ
jgi:transposase